MKPPTQPSSALVDLNAADLECIRDVLSGVCIIKRRDFGIRWCVQLQAPWYVPFLDRWFVQLRSKWQPVGWQYGNKFIVEIYCDGMIPSSVSAVVYDRTTASIRLPHLRQEDMLLFYEEAGVANLNEIVAWLDLFYGNYGWWKKQTASKIVTWNGLARWNESLIAEDIEAGKLPYDKNAELHFYIWNVWGGHVMEIKKAVGPHAPIQRKWVSMAGDFYQTQNC